MDGNLAMARQLENEKFDEYMIYKQLALKQAISELGSVQFLLGKINDEPEVALILEKVKEATAKLIEVEAGISDHLEEHR